MASKIEWTTNTWNPIRAVNRETGGRGHFCEHVSEGCRHCYAERMQPRFNNPVRFAAQDRDKVDLVLDDDVLTKPLRWRKPRRVFVCSMTDLFLDHHPDAWLDRVFAVMALCPQHTFQVLTKRPERMRAYMMAAAAAGRIGDAVQPLRTDDNRVVGPLPHVEPGARWWPLANVWLGVSVENQATAAARAHALLDTPAAVRFVSYEPALGPVDWTRYFEVETDNNGPILPGLDWIIAVPPSR